MVIQHRQGSTSLLQRRLKIGYGRAARIIDQLEEAGVLSPSEGGARPREVLVGSHDLDRICGSTGRLAVQPCRPALRILTRALASTIVALSDHGVGTDDGSDAAAASPPHSSEPDVSRAPTVCRRLILRSRCVMSLSYSSPAALHQTVRAARPPVALGGQLAAQDGIDHRYGSPMRRAPEPSENAQVSGAASQGDCPSARSTGS